MRLLGRFYRARGDAAEPLPDLHELTVWLAYKRGENITVVDSAGNIPPNRDAIKHMANAARDGRFIDRTMEDRLISDLTTYRKLG
ncbi:MAG: hypothetical protein GY713_03510 [Actinomycetia bacterium]|nr:hypothetical protein [Actinomycetes bacterium]MCP3910002.1 hypothetical protein [Actinomycetes bacterium]